MNITTPSKNQTASMWKKQLQINFGYTKRRRRCTKQDFCFINFTLKEEIIAGKQCAEFISENSTLNVIAIPYKSNSAVSTIKVHYFYNTNFYKYSLQI